MSFSETKANRALNPEGDESKSMKFISLNKNVSSPTKFQKSSSVSSIKMNGNW